MAERCRSVANIRLVVGIPGIRSGFVLPQAATATGA